MERGMSDPAPRGTRVQFDEGEIHTFPGEVTHVDSEGMSVLVILDVPAGADVEVGDTIEARVWSRLMPAQEPVEGEDDAEPIFVALQ